ncbi:disulfide bond formation protein B [Roseitranquillus sediminis]|uniref:disulfide bond formation protein B n=1 Tax=Roseitranquillus sediminis TaxID=2809051 RepID=UPI001D0C4396|nr:disulfide bond formation protein B [Roseitranquillus sediminis]MBM9595619.1 disulfide bond formation protein B [Roseitranquillus sediminis]
MTRRHLMVLAGLGSLGLLVGAWVFQSLGYYPCKLCLWQRWPHSAAALMGAVAIVAPVAPVAIAGAFAAATTGAIGVYHAGVERDWWEGPATCTAGDISGLSTEQLMDQILNAPIVRCDDIAWQLAGISMAGWNAILSFGLAALWLYALRFNSAGTRP